MASPTAFIAILDRNRSRNTTGALWRQAGAARDGSDGIWNHVSEISQTYWHNDLPQEVVRKTYWGLQQADLFVIDPGIAECYEPFSEHELDVLGNARSIAFEADTSITMRVDASGMPLLVRLMADGMIEVVAFARARRAEPMVYVTAPGHRHIPVLLYTRFNDQVCGHPRTGTRIMDCGRISPWESLRALCQAGEVDAARAAFLNFFAHDINPLYAVPWEIAPKRIAIEGLSSEATHRFVALAQDALMTSGSQTVPLSLSAVLPSSPAGIIRVPEDQVFLPIAASALRTPIAVLCSLAAYDIKAWGHTADGSSDSDPLKGYGPADALSAPKITAWIKHAVTGHARVAARRRLAAFWENEKNRPDFGNRLAAVIRGRGAASEIVAQIDEWIAG